MKLNKLKGLIINNLRPFLLIAFIALLSFIPSPCDLLPSNTESDQTQRQGDPSPLFEGVARHEGGGYFRGGGYIYIGNLYKNILPKNFQK